MLFLTCEASWINFVIKVKVSPWSSWLEEWSCSYYYDGQKVGIVASLWVDFHQMIYTLWNFRYHSVFPLKPTIARCVRTYWVWYSDMDIHFRHMILSFQAWFHFFMQLQVYIISVCEIAWFAAIFFFFLVYNILLFSKGFTIVQHTNRVWALK